MWNEPFNEFGSGLSIPDNEDNAYDMKVNESEVNLLTNSSDVNFTISELEVWLIQEIL